MFTWLKNLMEKEETFVCWFFRFKHEDNAIKFEVKAKRHDIKNIVKVIRDFLNYIGCDGCSDWHFWIDDYCHEIVSAWEDEDEDAYLNFETVKKMSKEFYDYEIKMVEIHHD